MEKNYLYFEFYPYLMKDENIYTGKIISTNIKRIVKWYQNSKRNILYLHLPEKYKDTKIYLVGCKNTIYGKITKNKFVKENIDYLLHLIIDPDSNGNYPIKIDFQKYLVIANKYKIIEDLSTHFSPCQI